LTARDRDAPPLEIDFSEVEGLDYRCLDDCALCCLCQPELLPSEEAEFRSHPELCEAIADRHISPDVRGVGLKLRGDHGACYFLENKRCRIYDRRPHFCSMFPVNIFLGWRAQINVNMSCRGIGMSGQNLKALARKSLADYSPGWLSAELATARKVFADFIRNTRAMAVSQSFSSVRASSKALEDELIDRTGLSRIMTYAEFGSTRQDASARDIVRCVRRTEPEADIEERASVDGTELFDLPDLSLLPIYIDEGLRWKVFRLVGKEIVGYLLFENGATEEFSRIHPSEVGLLPVSSAGRSAMKSYLGTVNARDCFLGHAAYLCDADGYEFNFAQAYLGALANNAIDLWWRASFLAHMGGMEELGPLEVREGIIFFDMDLLDLPTIGAFV